MTQLAWTFLLILLMFGSESNIQRQRHALTMQKLLMHTIESSYSPYMEYLHVSTQILTDYIDIYKNVDSYLPRLVDTRWICLVQFRTPTTIEAHSQGRHTKRCRAIALCAALWESWPVLASQKINKFTGPICKESTRLKRLDIGIHHKTLHF